MTKTKDISTSPGLLKQTEESNATPYLTKDQTIENLKLADIKQFKGGFSFVDGTEAFLPVIINTPKGNYCIDGYKKIKQARKNGEMEINCNVYKIEEHSEIELMLRTLAGRSKPTAGRARYPELILGVKKATKLLKAKKVNIKSFNHGGARKGADFNDNQENNINVLLSKRLGRSVDTVRKQHKFSQDVDDTTLKTLAKKDKELDGKGSDAKRPSKSFFEKVQTSKNDFIDRLNAEENGKDEEKKLSDKDKITLISEKVLEAFDQYSKGSKITAFSGEEEKPAEKTNTYENFTKCLKKVQEIQTLTGNDKARTMMECAEELMVTAKECGKKDKIIKVPEFPAREYSPLSLNYYTSCDHGCVYCYNNRWKEKNSSPVKQPKPAARKDVLKLIREDAQRMKFLGINDKQVMLSFWGDPYCCEEKNLNLTTEVLEILLQNKIPTAILTKGGTGCLKDLELFKKFGKGIKVGATLTFTGDKHSKYFEPDAALPQDRFDALEKLHKAGVKTWISMEPVIDVNQSLEIIEITNKYVDQYMLGKLNHNKVETLVNGKFAFNNKPNFKNFLHEAVKKLRLYNNDFYVKEALRKCDPTFKLEDHETDMDHLTLKKFK